MLTPDVAIAKLIEVEAKVLTYTAGQAIEKRGTLNFKGKPTWFVLREGALMWFPAEDDPRLEGSTTVQKEGTGFSGSSSRAAACKCNRSTGEHCGGRGLHGRHSGQQIRVWVPHARGS